MYYTVYKIRNLVNNKIYIGVHKTEDIDDGYMGSGLLLRRAQEKYGIENFTKEILEVFNSSEEMFDMESLLVNEDFVSRADTYNLKEGGYGGWDHITSEHLANSTKRKVSQPLNAKKGLEAIRWLYENDREWIEKKTAVYSKSIIKYYESGGKNGFLGREHSEETLEKLRGHTRQTGNKNSQFGTMWIYNLEEKLSKKIKKEELPTWEQDGWLKGRKMKF